MIRSNSSSISIALVMPSPSDTLTTCELRLGCGGFNRAHSDLNAAQPIVSEVSTPSYLNVFSSSPLSE
jgi:hypothetical protein